MRRFLPAAWLLLLSGVFLAAQNPDSGRWYYAIENLASKAVIRRATTTSNGIPANDLILAPNTRYREWLLDASTGNVGFQDFTTPDAGQRFTIPPILLRPPLTPDRDNDALSEDAEFILDTDPAKADTDGDGITDGAAARLGLPTGGTPTGVVGGVDTPGTAVDICAFNDLVMVADAERGVSIFNVFNGMNPLLIAQVDTPAPAISIACSGNYIAVGMGSGGLAIINAIDPRSAHITNVITAAALGGSVRAIATSGDLAYVGTATTLSIIELSRGTVRPYLNKVDSIEDLTEVDDKLYVLTSSELRIFTSYEQGIVDLGRVFVVGSPPPFQDRRRFFVGGGLAYVGNSFGFSVVSVTNSEAPILIAFPTTLQAAVHAPVLNGSGRLLSATSFGSPQTLAVSRFDVSNPVIITNFLGSLDTPGDCRALTLYNGLAYVADAQSGLTVVSDLPTDRLRVSPIVILQTSLSSNQVEETRTVLLSAEVTDDVQPRNVEFYIDGVKVATDGSFPFQYRFRTPRRSDRGRIVVSARASDTGGNFAWSEGIPIEILPDTKPPSITRISPGDGIRLIQVRSVTVQFDEDIDPASLGSNAVLVVFAGADGAFDTADDVAMTNGLIRFDPILRTVGVQFSDNLSEGNYKIIVNGIHDLAGNVRPTGISSMFVVTDALAASALLAIGGSHDLALRTNGTLWGWGGNYYGQLGDGTTTDQPTATLTATGRLWRAVGAGAYLSVAIAQDRSLWGWGLECEAGVLGTRIHPSPVMLGSNQTWKAIAPFKELLASSCSSDAFLAIDTDGILWGTTNGIGRRLQRIEVATNQAWHSVSVGDRHVIGIATNGSLWSWGADTDYANHRGQLGNGTTIKSVTPIQIGLTNKWAAVSAGEAHSVALATDGSLWTWGDNTSGQLGDGTFVSFRSTARQILSGMRFVAIAAAGGHTVAISSDGTLWGWGGNDVGQLGDGYTYSRNIPFQIATNRTWVAVATRGSWLPLHYAHTLALASDGTLWSWGDASYGRLGDPNRSVRSTPVRVATNIIWKTAVAGSAFSLAITEAGDLWAWGRNRDGQVGDGSMADRSLPTRIGVGKQWISASSGTFFSMALASDRTLWAWGDNYDGYLGDGTRQTRYAPTQVATNNLWKAISAGRSYTLALATSGELWAWGENFAGVFGNGTTLSTTNPVRGATNRLWKSISAGGEDYRGYSHVAAVATDDTLWGWGGNSRGQLGDNSYTDSYLPVQVGTNRNWANISAGPVHTLAITSGGILWAWGENENCQLGTGTGLSAGAPILSGTNQIWSVVSAGGPGGLVFADDGYSLGVSTNGALWAWGRNTAGRLGIDSPFACAPIQVGTNTNWRSVSAGLRHSLAVTTNGELWAWGSNGWGELGIGVAPYEPGMVSQDNDWGAAR